MNAEIAENAEKSKRNLTSAISAASAFPFWRPLG